MITFSHRRPEDLYAPFCEGPVNTTRFYFQKLGRSFSGEIKYEWFRLMGEHHLIIHTVEFKYMMNNEVWKLIEPKMYDYLVECAKESAEFLTYRQIQENNKW